MRRRLAVLALALAATLGLGATSAAPARQVVFAEDATIHESSGTLWPDQERILDLPVREANVTRVEVHLRWEGEGATLGLAVRDPDGRAPTDAARGDAGALVLAVEGFAEVPAPVTVAPEDEAETLAGLATSAGQGTWRVTLTMDEDAPDARAFTLTVVVYHYGAIPLRVVTMAGDGDAPPLAWGLLTGGMAGLAVVLGVRVLRPPRAPDAPSVLPAGDNTASPGTGQGTCAPEG